VVTTPRAKRGRPRARTAPKPRKLPRNDRSAAAYEAILIAAERVLAEHDVAGLTTNRIAEVAGVSIGSLYQYFPHKEAIAAVLIDRYVARFMGAATEIIARNPSTDPISLVNAIGGAVAQIFRDMQPVHRHLRDLRAVAGKLEPVDRALDKLVDLVEAYLRSRPELDLDPRLAAFTIVHTVDGTVNAFAVRQQSLPPPLDDPDTFGRELAAMIGAYLKSHTRLR
jgi:AcrR family transcriptional regulator